MIEQEFLRFPDRFHWGFATAAIQVEGRYVPYSSVYQYYRKNAHRFAARASRNLRKTGSPEDIANLAPLLADPLTFIPNGSIKHYEDYERDLRHFRDLGLNSYRFSLQRAAIEPQSRQYNQKEIEHYRRVINTALELGITPIPTIHHWDEPIHVTQSGGFMTNHGLYNFAKYVEKIAPLFIGLPYVVSMNEPVIDGYKRHVQGMFPPGDKWNVPKWVKHVDQSVKAHRIARTLLKKEDPDIQVGITQNIAYFEPLTKTPLDTVSVAVRNRLWNDYPFDAAGDSLDWIGIQYYFREPVKYGVRVKGKDAVWSDRGKDISPHGLYEEIKRLYVKYKKPIIISETGVPTRNDALREWYFRKIIPLVHQAIQEGADVRGLLQWCAFSDVQEWEDGSHPLNDFGGMARNKVTNEWEPRPSAEFFGETARNNGLWIPLKEGIPAKLPV